ncbi:MAG: hypothetical protein GF330_08065 [Candidatus Eisenbacteria bacterium]|nr:hypothetical protein [Candidatus Eisenbacteria bacterium]
MRNALLLILAIAVGGIGVASAEMHVSGYLAPHLMMYDQGEDNEANVGFGMYFNRFTFKGKMDGGEIVKAVGFRVESDISSETSSLLKWAYVQPYFTEELSFRIGHIKRAFSREWLHPTMDLITAMRHPTSDFLKGLGYTDFAYGLDVLYKAEMFMVQAGAYTSGTPKTVEDQDPALDFGGRVVAMPIEGLEVGLNAVMTTLPHDGTMQGSNQGVYPSETYETNSGLAYGFDVDYMTDFDKMSLWAQAEVGMGDCWTAGPKDAEAGDTWEDYEWFSFMYYYLKLRFMFTEELGFQLGYSMFDPVTENDDDEYPGTEYDKTTKITPGLIYFWTPLCRTEVEVQLCTEQGYDAQTGDGMDYDYTHFLLQQVLVWK